MKRWMSKKAGSVVLAAATGLSTLSPAPLWSQNPDPAGSDIQRRLAELYAREGKTMPKSAPQLVAPVSKPAVPEAPQSHPRWGSDSPVQVEMTPRPSAQRTRLPMGIQAPVSGDHPQITNTPVVPSHPLITPRQAAADVVETDPAPPVPAIRPIPMPQTKTASQPEPQSNEANPDEDVKITPHPLRTRPVAKTPGTKNPSTPKYSPFKMPVVKESKQPGGNPFAMPVVKEQSLAPPRPAITQTPKTGEPKPRSGNPFAMPVVKTGSKPQPTPQGNTFEVTSAASQRLPEVALEGCCPVTLREEGKRVKGRPELIAIWNRGSYHFVSPEAQQKFEQNPHDYAAVPSGLSPSHSEASLALAMEGCCPVALREERKFVKGRSDLVSTWNHARYRFASDAAKQKFAQNPGHYAPAESGFDVTLLADANRKVAGSLNHAVWFHKELYLFQSQATQDAFTANPRKYLPQK